MDAIALADQAYLLHGCHSTHIRPAVLHMRAGPALASCEADALLTACMCRVLSPTGTARGLCGFKELVGSSNTRVQVMTLTRLHYSAVAELETYDHKLHTCTQPESFQVVKPFQTRGSSQKRFQRSAAVLALPGLHESDHGRRQGQATLCPGYRPSAAAVGAVAEAAPGERHMVVPARLCAKL